MVCVTYPNERQVEELHMVRNEEGTIKRVVADFNYSSKWADSWCELVLMSNNKI